MDRINNSDNEQTYCWYTTFPFLDAPYEGESIFGYILRMDSLNHFSPGTILNMIKLNKLASFNNPCSFLIDNCINIDKLAQLVGLSLDNINSLRLPSYLRFILQSNTITKSLITYSSIYRICPECIREGKIPLIHIFKKVNVCIDHKLMLESRCTCGRNIVLFSSNSMIYHCPFCGENFSGLGKRKTNNNYLMANIYYYEIFHKLLHEYEISSANNTQLNKYSIIRILANRNISY